MSYLDYLIFRNVQLGKELMKSHKGIVDVLVDAWKINILPSVA